MQDSEHRRKFRSVMVQGGAGVLTLIALACCVMASYIQRAAAGSEPKSVLELFTSQGCSSCPRADALLNKFISRGDVIALSFPVDYWDYAGWKDTLATPENADRQQFYAQHCPPGNGRVYTPQMVVNGLSLVPGNAEDRINAEIAYTSNMLKDEHVPVGIQMTGGGLMVTAGKATGTQHVSGTVLLAAVTRSVDVEIRRGENAGKKMTYFNVVRQIIPLGKWTGTVTNFEVPAGKLGEKSPDLYVAMLQSEDGSILGAAADAGR
jgi:hypothetical protein